MRLLHAACGHDHIIGNETAVTPKRKLRMDTVYESRKFAIIRTGVNGHDGREHQYEFVRHPGAVVILPLISNESLLMIRNYRHAVGRELLELPAGTLDAAGESPIETAHRELEEETGHRAAILSPLDAFYPSPGILSEKIHAFVATDIVRTRQRLEPTERITVQAVPCDEAIEMAYDGRIEDAKTALTLLRWNWRQRKHR